jgi:hypothetical protein
MEKILFLADQYIWTGKGEAGDAVPLRSGQMGIVLDKGRRHVLAYSDPRAAYILLLDDGRVVWTTMFPGLMELVEV